MKSLTKIRLVTFDVTGTLLKFRKDPIEFYKDEAIVHGYDPDLGKMKKNFKHGWKEMNEHFSCFGAKQNIHWIEWWRILVFKTFEGSHIPEDMLQKISVTLVEKFKTTDCWRVADGATEFLNLLNLLNIRAGIITNFDPRINTVLENLSIKSQFEFVINSFDAKLQKPDRALFHLALQKANVHPSEAVHIGDNLELDFKAAKDAGLNAILINKQHQVGESSDWEFRDLIQLTEYFKKN